MANKSIKHLLKILVRIPVFLVISFFISIFGNTDYLLQKLVFYFLILTIITEISIFLVNKIRQKLPREKYKFLHILIQIPLITGCIFLVLMILQIVLKYLPKPDEDINYWYCLFISGGTAILITTIYEGIDFFRHWKQYIIRAEQIEKANLVAKYETLKKQVHPHFLFNGLNTLIGLIENKDPKASQYAQNLADFLKQLLSLQNQELITLSEELQMVNQYRFIQQVRFNNTLKIKIDVDKALNNKQLPPLAIQMLVENAIKHNITSQSKPLNIQIKNINSMILEVTNNLQPKKSEHSAKVGLKNMEERYKYITDRKVEIIKNSDSFTVKIPLI